VAALEPALQESAEQTTIADRRHSNFRRSAPLKARARRVQTLRIPQSLYSIRVILRLAMLLVLAEA
jgi:hypothetical protein